MRETLPEYAACAHGSGALHASRTVAENAGIEHRGGDVVVAEEFLNATDVVAALQQVRCDRVAESVASHPLFRPAARAAFLPARCTPLSWLVPARDAGPASRHWAAAGKTHCHCRVLSRAG